MPATCLTDCLPRIGILSAFGAEADLLLVAMTDRHDWMIQGNRFSTGILQGQAVVVALTGVSLVNASMTTQLLADHFHLTRLLLSGIAGGIDPAGAVGDVTVPERWALPLETWWGPDGTLPAPCGAPGVLDCLGLRLAQSEGRVLPDFRLLGGTVPTGLWMRETFVRTPATGLAGEFRLFYPVDAAMLAVARALQPPLQRCGPRAPGLCVSGSPTLQVGGTGVSVPAFLANAEYRQYLQTTLRAKVLDMETAAVAHVAYSRGLPFLAFRSVSDLAGGGPNSDVGALFGSGLAETNAAAVTLGWLAAWGQQAQGDPMAPTAGTPAAVAAETVHAARLIKVLIITMFPPEAEPWLQPLHLDTLVPVAGLSAEHPALYCNDLGVCLLITGMGHANAAASTLAVALDPHLDLHQTWFLVAGIAGIDPAMATIGSATWAYYLVDAGLTQELDARERPAAWLDGFVGIGASGPGAKPKLEYGTEVFELDARLVQKALRLTQQVVLEDSAAAQAYRRRYREPAARAAPQVLACDTLAGDAWWHGHRLGEHARRWTRLLTDGHGRYCTTQQEDNATAEALRRGAADGRLDAQRLLVLRAGANFDRPAPGQDAFESLRADSGAFVPATHNLYRVGGVVVRDILQHWDQWALGVPDN